MLNLPPSTQIHKPLAKKAIFARFKVSAAARKLFDEQISRLAIVAEISPQTVNIAASEKIAAVFVVLVQLKSAQCDAKNIALLSRLINQRMLFALQYQETVRLAVQRAGKVLLSEPKATADWEIPLRGLDMQTVWDNIITQIGGLDPADDQDLDERIAAKFQTEKRLKKIAALENKMRKETQPRRKWEYHLELKKLMDSG